MAAPTLPITFPTQTSYPPSASKNSNRRLFNNSNLSADNLPSTSTSISNDSAPALSRQNSTTRLTAVAMLRRAASQRELRNNTNSPQLSDSSPQSQPQSASHSPDISIVNLQPNSDSNPNTGLSIPNAGPSSHPLHRAGSAAGDYGRAGVGLARARARAVAQGLALAAGVHDGDDGRDDNDYDNGQGEREGDRSYQDRDDDTLSDPTESPTEELQFIPTPTPTSLSFLPRPENPTGRSAEPSPSNSPPAGFSAFPQASRFTPTPTKNLLQQSQSQSQTQPQSQVQPSLQSRSPLPSLAQLRARILHERANQGLARSASTGAAGAASAASRAARLYAMEKLLGSTIGDEDSKFLSTERRRFSRSQARQSKKLDSDPPNDDSEGSISNSGSDGEGEGGRGRKQGGTLRPGSMIGALSKGRAPSPETEPRAWEITENFKKSRSVFSNDSGSSGSESNRFNGRSPLDRNGKGPQNSSSSSNGSARISSLSERERRKTLRRSRTIGSLNERFEARRKEDFANGGSMNSEDGEIRNKSFSSSSSSTSGHKGGKIFNDQNPIFEDPIQEDERERNPNLITEAEERSDSPNSSNRSRKGRNALIQLGREAAENWKFQSRKPSDDKSGFGEPDRDRDAHSQRRLELQRPGMQDTDRTLNPIPKTTPLLPGWQVSPNDSPEKGFSDVPTSSFANQTSLETSSISTSNATHPSFQSQLPAQDSIDVKDSSNGLQRQLSQRQIARTEMMRKLSGRGKNLGRGVAETSVNEVSQQAPRVPAPAFFTTVPTSNATSNSNSFSSSPAATSSNFSHLSPPSNLLPLPNLLPVPSIQNSGSPITNSPSSNYNSNPNSNPNSHPNSVLYNPSVRAISSYSNTETEGGASDRDHFQYQFVGAARSKESLSGSREVELSRDLDKADLGSKSEIDEIESEDLNLGRGTTSWIATEDSMENLRNMAVPTSPQIPELPPSTSATLSVPTPEMKSTSSNSSSSSRMSNGSPISQRPSIGQSSENDGDRDRERESIISGQSVPLGLGNGNIRNSNYLEDSLPSSDSLVHNQIGSGIGYFGKLSHDGDEKEKVDVPFEPRLSGSAFEKEVSPSADEVQETEENQNRGSAMKEKSERIVEQKQRGGNSVLDRIRRIEEGNAMTPSNPSSYQPSPETNLNSKPTLPPLSTNPSNLNVPQTLSPSIALSPSESIASISTSASPSKGRRRRSKARSIKSLRRETNNSIKGLRVYGSDEDTETGSQWDGEEIDLDAYMRDSESDEGSEEEEGEGKHQVDQDPEEEPMGLGIQNASQDQVKEVEVQPPKPELAPIKVTTPSPRPAGHHRSSSVLSDLGEKPSERLQALLGASFVQQYGDAAYFDQPSPMEFGEEKRLGWKPPSQVEETGREVGQDQDQHQRDSLTESEILPIEIQDTRKFRVEDQGQAHGQDREVPSSKPPIPNVPVPERLLAAVDTPSSLQAPGSSTPSDSKTPVSNSQFAHWQSQGPVPQFDSTRQLGSASQPLSSAKPFEAIPQQQSQSSLVASAPSISHAQTYHPPPASSAQLASFYADDKLRPFPGFMTPNANGPTPLAQGPPIAQAGHSRSDSRSGDNSSPVAGNRAFAAPSPVNSPAELGSTPATLSRAPSAKSSNFFSTLRRKASGAASPSGRLFGSSLHKRSGSALGFGSGSRTSVAREDSPVQVISKQSTIGNPIITSHQHQPPQADRLATHSRSMSASSVASSRQPDQSFNSASTSTRIDTMSPVQAFDSERLANGRAEHLRSEEDSRDTLEVQYALEPSTAAKLQRYSQMLTNPISPTDYPSSSPLRTENVIPDLPAGAAGEHVPGISSESLIDPPRRLIRAGPIYQVVSDTMVKDRFLLLFDDIIVIAKPVAPPLPASRSAQETPTPNPVQADLEWTFSAKSMVELHHVKLSTPKETASQPKEHPLMASFVTQFKTDPTGALERIIAQSSLPRDASTVAQLLFHTPGLDRGHLTAYINAAERRNVLQAYIGLFRLSSVSIESALRSFLLELRFPTRAQEFEALLLTFAKRWTEANSGLIKPAFTSQLGADLVYAIMALNDAVHSGQPAASPSRKAPGLFSEPISDVSRATFLTSFRAHDPGMVLSDRTLSRIYSSVVSDTLAQSLFPEEASKRIGICVVGALPSKLTFGIASEPITLRIPEKDRDFAIRLYGQDLTFDPPILAFDSSNERSFTITSRSIGNKHAVFVRAGRNAQLYTAGPPGIHQSEGEVPLPRSSAISVERAFVRNSFTLSIIGGADTSGVAKRRYMFSVADDEARSEWVRILKGSIKKSVSNRKNLSSSRRAADAIARDVLREALIEADDFSAAASPTNTSSALQRSASASATPQASQRLPPSSFKPTSQNSTNLARNVSHSQHYYSATGKMEKELLTTGTEENQGGNPLRRAATQFKDGSGYGYGGGRLEPLSTISSHSSNSRSLSPASAVTRLTPAIERLEEGNEETTNNPPMNKDLTGEALVTTCRQNSLLPLVLDQLRSSER